MYGQCRSTPSEESTTDTVPKNAIQMQVEQGMDIRITAPAGGGQNREEIAA